MKKLILSLIITLLCHGVYADAKQDAIKQFGKVPVLELGRYKPWDSVARNSLLMFYERQELRTEEDKWTAMEWLAEVLFDSARADNRQVFRVMHPDVRVLLGNKEEDQKFFSFNEIIKVMPEIAEQSDQARQLEAQLRNPYQRAIVSLSNNVAIYQGMKRSFSPPGTLTLNEEIKNYLIWSGKPLEAFRAYQNGEEFDTEEIQKFFQSASIYKSLSEVAKCLPIPPQGDPENDDWINVWDSFVQTAPQATVPVAISLYADLADNYRSKDWQAFELGVELLLSELAADKPEVVSKASLENSFNQSELFYRTALLYVAIFLIVMVSWIKWPIPLGKLAFWLLALALILHTSGLIIRMVIQDRPPVTNLYSSALFVGWGGAILGLVLERLFKNGIGAATAAMIGCLSLVVAHNLALDGDTMAMLQAVLDTNFWLATHVVVITFGYSATFFAGFLALMYIFFGFFTKFINEERGLALERMVFGIICFALLFSFVGTVLGGIWADQSWGRFWGWDPKENGALLIVLWNAIILHARWGKIIGRQGTMVAAVFGNIVTAWSWFGTNMLGVGLHSYGFMDQAFFWLLAFAFFMLMFMAIGLIPPRLWDSIASRKKEGKSKP
jgi:ABC-type transport system involved in cytochrome c biogenesis permease subunit